MARLKLRRKKNYQLLNTFSFSITIKSEFGLEITIRSKMNLTANSINLILKQIDFTLSNQKEYPLFLLENFVELNTNVDKVKYWESLKNRGDEEIIRYENLIISFS